MNKKIVGDPRFHEWLEKINPFAKAKEHITVIQITEAYFKQLPEPKLSDDLSFHLLNVLILENFKLGNLKQAELWAHIFSQFNFQKAGRIDSGHMDVTVGRIFYELGNTETAFHHWTIADKKSGGRCFQLPFSIEGNVRKAYLQMCADKKKK